MGDLGVPSVECLTREDLSLDRRRILSYRITLRIYSSPHISSRSQSPGSDLNTIYSALERHGACSFLHLEFDYLVFHCLEVGYMEFDCLKFNHLEFEVRVSFVPVDDT